MPKTKLPKFLLAILIFLGGLSLPPSALMASAQGTAISASDQDCIDALIHSSMEAANIPGLALGIVSGDEIVYLRGYGIAAPDGRAVTPQTPFILGSTSKSFTALAVMQLVEQGRIDLDAPVTAYLPWFRTADAAASAQITVRHLLHQTSGLPTSVGRLGFADDDQSEMALENGIRALSDVQLSRPAGQGYEYANDNYNTLGLIIQAVTAQSYEDYVRTEIFDPLQMSHSAAELSDPAADDIATGYRYWFYWPAAFDAPFPRRMTPAGFLISSAEDMSHYLVAQLNGGAYGSHEILSPEGIETLHTSGARMSSSSGYGMGWVIEDQSGATRIWHNGDVRNFHSNLLLLPDQGIGVVILVNVGGFLRSGAIDAPIEGIADILLGNNAIADTTPPFTIIPQVMLLAATLIPVLWITGSYLAIRQWGYRCELPPHGVRRFWRFYLPLTVDLLPVGIVWTLLPAQFHASMVDVALFALDAFLMIVALTMLCIGWSVYRVRLTFHSHRLMQTAGG